MPGPGKFLLVHRDAADDLLEIFAEENAGEEALDLGEAVGPASRRAKAATLFRVSP